MSNLKFFPINIIKRKLKNSFLRNTLIKKNGDFLLNQDVFPGMGNIIRNEVLFLSKIQSESFVSNIPTKKIKELILNIKDFAQASVNVTEQKIWKSSASVYRKKHFKDHEITEYVAPKIKRRTFVDEKVQKIILARILIF